MSKKKKIETLKTKIKACNANKKIDQNNTQENRERTNLYKSSTKEKKSQKITFIVLTN